MAEGTGAEFMTQTQTTSTDEAAERKPWDGKKDMKLKLEHAGWRYAQLIGIVDVVPDDIPEHEAKTDKAKYPHFVNRDKFDRPIWDVNEATIFVHELTGYDRRTCAMWLDYDWYDGGEKTDT